MIFLTLPLRSLAIRYIRLILEDSMMPKYAVAVGRKVGIYDTYDECKLQVLNYPKAKFKKFDSLDAAEAYIKEHFFNNKLNIDPMMQVAKENVNRPELIKVEKISPKSDMFAIMTRIQSIEERLNKFITDTTSTLENIVTRLNTCEAKCASASLEPPLKKIKIDSESTQGLKTNEDGFTIVYTDGACSKNGQMGAKAGIGVWFNDEHPLNISAPVQGPATNNNAEIQAARVAITQASLAGVRKLRVNTDSKFVINCITQWIHKWKKNDWKLSMGAGTVKNKEELVKLDNAIQTLEVVEWVYVAGHRGIHGNEMADKLARAGANRYKTNLTFSTIADTYNVSYANCDK